MKIYKYIAMVLGTVTIVSCSNDDDASTEISGEGNLRVEFDNAYKTSDLLLGTSNYEANGSETIKIDSVKYIISNIRLEDSEGNIFTYPKNESYFIVNESNETTRFLSLSNVPAGDYTKITFGVGVDQEKYLEGAEGQGDFLDWATTENMMWSWQAGYVFMRYEGKFTSDNVPDETAFAVHMGSHGSELDNYREVTLSLPNSARVRSDKEPEIHVIADLSAILSGPNKISLEEHPQIHVDPELAVQISENINSMFTVDHVHNE